MTLCNMTPHGEEVFSHPLWPFESKRYFAPWTPIPVAPIGKAFFTSAGRAVALTELLLFSPLFVYGLWPRART